MLLALTLRTQLVVLVSLCRNLNESTRRELYRFQSTSSEPQEEGSSIDNKVISISKPTLMLSMQVTREIVNLPQAIAHILEVTLSLGDRKNIRWYHALAQSEYQVMAETAW